MPSKESQLKNVTLFAPEGRAISLQIMQTLDGKTLFECFEPEILMDYLQMDHRFCFTSDCYLRGVAIPGEGAVFEVFDSYGSLNSNEIRLTEKETEDLLLSRLS